jgi:hypothetical protein
MRDAAMLLLLRRPLRGTVTFCAFEKFREPTTAHKTCKEQRSDCLIKEHVHAKSDLQIENQVIILRIQYKRMPMLVAVGSKAPACGRTLAGILG